MLWLWRMRQDSWEMNKYQIKKGIEVPEFKNGGSAHKYPFSQMAVGDCFFLEVGERNNISAAACEYAKARPPMKFTVRSTGSTDRLCAYGCWRIA